MREPRVIYEMYNRLLKNKRLLLSLPLLFAAALFIPSNIVPSAHAQSDFSLATAASSLAIPAGSSGSDVLTVTSLSGFTGTVTLANGNVPSGVTVSFSTNPVVISTAGGSASSFMTIFAGAPAGTTFIIIVTGTSGTLSHSVNLTVAA